MCRLNIPSHHLQPLPLFHHLMLSGICLHHLFRCLSNSFSLPHHPAIYLQDWMTCMLYVLANLVSHQPTLSCFSTLFFNRGAITPSSCVNHTLTYPHIQFVSFHNISTLLVCIQIWHLQIYQAYTLYYHYPGVAENTKYYSIEPLYVIDCWVSCHSSQSLELRVWANFQPT